jgi:hypothetical protein
MQAVKLTQNLPVEGMPLWIAKTAGLPRLMLQQSVIFAARTGCPEDTREKTHPTLPRKPNLGIHDPCRQDSFLSLSFRS